MAIIDLFSKRKKLSAQSGKPDVYSYDKLPNQLRVQIAHIWRDAIGDAQSYGSDEAVARWQFIHDAIAREKGVFELTTDRDYESRCLNWFLRADTDDALDMVELSFRLIERVVDKLDFYVRRQQGVKINAEDAIQELNIRFRENGIGYRLEGGQIIRIDSQYVHAEITLPALSLLQGKSLEKANEEFMTAHRHYRAGAAKDCVVACQRAFESALKAICTNKKWRFEAGDRVTELLKIVRAKGLFPSYLDNGFDTYVAMLKTGLPGVRNNAGGHGEAPNALAVPDYVAAYALHMTATNIVLALEASNAVK